MKMDPEDTPKEPLPPPPAHHVADDYGHCKYGWIHLSDPPRWRLCDCEDPAEPWPPRSQTDGPRDCECYLCGGKPRRDRGRAPCEHADHHCEECHEHGICTTLACLLARSCPTCLVYKPASGDEVCSCGERYREHPQSEHLLEGKQWLRRLCDGQLVEIR